MAEIQKIAEMQMDRNNEECIGFEFEGQFIVNPWMDPSGRFDLSTGEALKLYGVKFLQFLEDMRECYDA